MGTNIYGPFYKLCTIVFFCIVTNMIHVPFIRYCEHWIPYNTNFLFPFSLDGWIFLNLEKKWHSSGHLYGKFSLLVLFLFLFSVWYIFILDRTQLNLLGLEIECFLLKATSFSKLVWNFWLRIECYLIITEGKNICIIYHGCTEYVYIIVLGPK